MKIEQNLTILEKFRKKLMFVND